MNTSKHFHPPFASLLSQHYSFPFELNIESLKLSTFSVSNYVTTSTKLVNYVLMKTPSALWSVRRKRRRRIKLLFAHITSKVIFIGLQPIKMLTKKGQSVHKSTGFYFTFNNILVLKKKQQPSFYFTVTKIKHKENIFLK